MVASASFESVIDASKELFSYVRFCPSRVRTRRILFALQGKGCLATCAWTLRRTASPSGERRTQTGLCPSRPTPYS
eukprot:8082894-Alexandrium_andersonii.AAC.1